MTRTYSFAKNHHVFAHADSQYVIKTIEEKQLLLFCVLIFFAKIVLLQSNIQTFAGYAVAPYVGAWIETILRSNCTVI